MKDQHTPEPWDTRHNGTAIYARGKDIARVYMNEGMSIGEHAANGNLMKAAPDMLVLLRRCLPACLDDRAPLTVAIKELLDSLDNPNPNKEET